MAKPLVYYPCEQKPGIGGPGGYLANLRAGLEAIGRLDVAHFVGDEAVKAPETRRTKARWILDRALATLALLPGPRRRLMARAKARRQVDRMASLLDALDFGSVICHDLVDVLAIDAYLRLRGRKVPIGLMSHCPELPSDELYAIQLAKRGLRAAQQTRAQARMLEQTVFARADFYVFPSKEAMEPYGALGALMKGKPVHFMASGCERLETGLSKETARAKFGVKTPLAVAYIGRHNAIKGYDVFQRAARDILAVRDDVTFLVAGRPSPLFPPLDHPRWVELGWVKTAEVLRAADVFCLPNRQTYYDLVLLEALSCGSVVLASATGGNKSVFTETDGALSLYDGEASLAPALGALLDLPEADREARRKRAQTAWEAHYTPSAFAERFVRLAAALDRATQEAERSIP